MNTKALVILAAGILIPSIFCMVWLMGAQSEMEQAQAAVTDDDAPQVAIASAAEDEYCTPALKKILRRVAGACGLLEGSGRGCQPADAKNVAALSGSDFNALFKPMAERVSIVQFDSAQSELDEGAQSIVEETWGQKRGASFFFVVSRASPEGNAAVNQRLSRERAEGVLTHLQTKFEDPDLKKEVGLMWLGEEFAQLDESFCQWTRSREGEECTTADINRSAFVAWIDCAI